MRPLSSIAIQWTAVEQLLDEALALPPDAREAWLAALDGERALHRDTLRELLQTQARIETGDFLDALPPLPMPTAAAEPRSGDLVGPYRLIRELGRGGMGLVWLAERADGIASRHLALKLPLQAWGQAFAERLAREREILASLEHEHIARLYDAGVDAHGRPYLAMQYVEGEPINDYCRHHQLSVPARIALLLQALSAVAHAHARLVVHRDLKPANVLVDAQGRLTLLDFGVAKLLAGERTDATALTELAGRALTPNYASPEQIRGEPLGTASDVYSLGVLAFELLAEARPYRLSRGSAAELEEAVLHAEPPRASDAATSPALKKALRGDLDAILAKALKKEVAERYAGADALASDLQRHLRGEPVLARPDGAGYRVAKFVGRHRLAVGMGGALTLAVLGGAGAALWQAEQAQAHERRASIELRRQHAVQDLYIETLSRLSVLGADDPAQVTRPGGVSSVLMDKLREFGERNASAPDEYGAQLESVMLQLHYDARYEESLAVGQQLLQHLKAHDGAPDDVLNTYATQGRTLVKLDRLAQAESMRREGLAWAPEATDAESQSIRLTLAGDLGDQLTNRGERAEALQVLNRADALAARDFASDHLRYATLMSLAFFYLGFDDARALKLMRQSQAEISLYGHADGDRRAQFNWWLSEALLANGELAEAEAAAQASLDLQRRESGRASRSALRAFSRLSGVVLRRDPARALALIRAERQWLGARPEGLSPAMERMLSARTLEAAWLSGDAAAGIAAATRDTTPLLKQPMPPDADLLLASQARVLLLAGRADEALPLAQALHAKRAEHAGLTVTDLRAELLLAEAQRAAGHADEALQTAQALLNALDATQGQASRTYRQALALGAWAAAQQGQRALADALMQRLERQPPPPFPSAVERADCTLLQAQALNALGRGSQAAALAREALGALATQHPQSPRRAGALALAQAGV